jgi:hypothetical protein
VIYTFWKYTEGPEGVAFFLAGNEWIEIEISNLMGMI